RNAESLLNHAIDQQVAAIADGLDRNLRGNVIDDLAQEGMVAVTFLFEGAPLGDILDGRDPAALCERSVDDLERATVGGFGDRAIGPALGDIIENGRTILLDIAIE